MKLSKKAKQALVTLRKEFGLTPDSISNLLGNTVSSETIKDFENDVADADECLTSLYLDLFSFIVFQRFRFEVEPENFDYDYDFDNDINEPQRFNPFCKR